MRNEFVKNERKTFNKKRTELERMRSLGFTEDQIKDLKSSSYGRDLIKVYLGFKEDDRLKLKDKKYISKNK